MKIQLFSLSGLWRDLQKFLWPFLIFWDPWCLRSPVVCKKSFFWTGFHHKKLSNQKSHSTSLCSEGFEKSWSSSKLWIFHNPLSHLLISFKKVPIQNLVELSWRKKCLWCPKVVYCLFSKIASFQPSSGP